MKIAGRQFEDSISFCDCGAEGKKGRIDPVKHWQITLAIFAISVASIVIAEDFKNINGMFEAVS